MPPLLTAIIAVLLLIFGALAVFGAFKHLGAQAKRQQQQDASERDRLLVSRLSKQVRASTLDTTKKTESTRADGTARKARTGEGAESATKASEDSSSDETSPGASDSTKPALLRPSGKTARNAHKQAKKRAKQAKRNANIAAVRAEWRVNLPPMHRRPSYFDTAYDATPDVGEDPDFAFKQQAIAEGKEEYRQQLRQTAFAKRLEAQRGCQSTFQLESEREGN